MYTKFQVEDNTVYLIITSSPASGTEQRTVCCLVGKMGAFSKFAEKSSYGPTVCRALYVGAIMAYIGGVAVPRWLNYNKAEHQLKKNKNLSVMSKQCPVKEVKQKAAVNKQFFEQLRKLLKVKLTDYIIYRSLTTYRL